MDFEKELDDIQNDLLKNVKNVIPPKDRKTKKKKVVFEEKPSEQEQQKVEKEIEEDIKLNEERLTPKDERIRDIQNLEAKQGKEITETKKLKRLNIRDLDLLITKLTQEGVKKEMDNNFQETFVPEDKKEEYNALILTGAKGLYNINCMCAVLLENICPIVFDPETISLKGLGRTYRKDETRESLMPFYIEIYKRHKIVIDKYSDPIFNLIMANSVLVINQYADNKFEKGEDNVDKKKEPRTRGPIMTPDKIKEL